jgi:hypothetical protein
LDLFQSPLLDQTRRQKQIWKGPRGPLALSLKLLELLSGDITRSHELLTKRFEFRTRSRQPTANDATLVEGQEDRIGVFADDERPGLSLLTNQLEDFCDPEIIQIAMQRNGHPTPYEFFRATRLASTIPP